MADQLQETEVQTQEQPGQEERVEAQQVQNQEIEQVVGAVDDPLGEIFSDRYPLSQKVESFPSEAVTTTNKEVKEEKKEVEKDTVTTAGSLDTEKSEKQELVQQQQQVQLNNEVAGLQAALLAERRKRQEAENALSQKNEQEEFNWDNPIETVNQIKTDLRQEFQQNFLSMSEAQAKSRYQDYDEKYQVFVNMAHENPAVVNTMLQQADPAEYAYQLAKQKMFTDEVGSDPVGYEEKLRAKIRAELEQEFNQKIEDKIKTVNSLPPSAASLSNKVQQKVVQNDDPLGDIFQDVPS